jgi:hypothetical protein
MLRHNALVMDILMYGWYTVAWNRGSALKDMVAVG